MINCSLCGTQNRDGSKFCSNCGARLTPVSGLICSMCGTANKVETVFCSNCGSRLAPLTAAPVEEKAPPPAPPIKGLSLPAKPAESIAETPAPTEETKPGDWIDQLRSSAPSEEEEATAPPTDQEAQVAEQKSESTQGEDWMARLRDTSTEPAAAEPEEIPDWLKPAYRPAEPAIEESAPPDWVSSLKPPAPVDESAMLDDADVPDWLKSSQSVPVEQVELPPAEPDWLKKPTSVPTLQEAEIPEWLRELKPTEETAPGEPLIESLETVTAESILPAGYDQLPASVDEDIPDWLRTSESATQEAEIQASPAEIQPALPEGMPDWIAALKPAQTSALEDEPVETAGPLIGLRGVLPLALAIAEPHTPTKPVPPAMRKESGNLFASILSATVPPAVPPAKKPGFTWSMRPFVYLLLALAVLIPFFIPFDLAGSSLRTLGTPTEAFYETLQALPPNSTVLLAFDYDPGTAWEMDLQAKSIARHLVQKNVRIIALSTFDTGAAIGERILFDAASGGYGTRYVNLGFLPGNEAGLASLADRGFAVMSRDFVQNQELGKLPVTANIKTLRDTQLVILLAGTENSLQAWMEQVQPRASVKIVAGVSAAVEPKAKVYTRSNQLNAMMSGLVGAAQYEILTGQPGAAVVSLNAQTPAQIVLVLVIVLGNLVYWTQRARGAQRGNG